MMPKKNNKVKVTKDSEDDKRQVKKNNKDGMDEKRSGNFDKINLILNTYSRNLSPEDYDKFSTAATKGPQKDDRQERKVDSKKASSIKSIEDYEQKKTVLESLLKKSQMKLESSPKTFIAKQEDLSHLTKQLEHWENKIAKLKDDHIKSMTEKEGEVENILERVEKQSVLFDKADKRIIKLQDNIANEEKRSKSLLGLGNDQGSNEDHKQVADEIKLLDDQIKQVNHELEIMDEIKGKKEKINLNDLEKQKNVEKLQHQHESTVRQLQIQVKAAQHIFFSTRCQTLEEKIRVLRKKMSDAKANVDILVKKLNSPVDEVVVNKYEKDLLAKTSMLEESDEDLDDTLEDHEELKIRDACLKQQSLHLEEEIEDIKEFNEHMDKFNQQPEESINEINFLSKELKLASIGLHKVKDEYKDLVRNISK